ncbi:MAG: NAD(P)(+) transhydrogenase (Re/Si-specific) subunit beta [Gemmatimonadaceae bacterium]|nr:NAD(P)(+) transhydrogenase (Re/Si-specific) subunit beta [Gemmatimonadaceae bacterium]
MQVLLAISSTARRSISAARSWCLLHRSACAASSPSPTRHAAACSWPRWACCWRSSARCCISEILTYQWIIAGLIIGTVMGYPLGKFVPMTAMPQRIAFSHMFGALAATLVGVAEFYHDIQVPRRHRRSSRFKMAAIGFEVLFGALTVTGSFMAFGKLQEFITGRPVTYKGQNFFNLLLFATAIGCFGYLIYDPTNMTVFFSMIAIAFVIGITMVLPIGGADMPVVVSLLNSYAGLAASATGFAIGNNVLIIAGALDGASGFILSIIMSKAMNRSFGNVLFGAFGSGHGAVQRQDVRGADGAEHQRRGCGGAAGLCVAR